MSLDEYDWTPIEGAAKGFALAGHFPHLPPAGPSPAGGAVRITQRRHCPGCDLMQPMGMFKYAKEPVNGHTTGISAARCSACREKKPNGRSPSVREVDDGTDTEPLVTFPQGAKL